MCTAYRQLTKQTTSYFFSRRSRSRKWPLEGARALANNGAAVYRLESLVGILSQGGRQTRRVKRQMDKLADTQAVGRR